MDSLFVFLFSSDVPFFPALHRVFSISDLALIESVSSPTFCLYPAHNISPPKPFSLHPSLPLPLNSQERPWPHSFIPLQDGDSAFSNYSTCSALSNIPSLCFHPFSHLPPTPRPIFFFLSITLLPLLSWSNLSPRGSDWQPSRALPRGDCDWWGRWKGESLLDCAAKTFFEIYRILFWKVSSRQPCL